MGSSVTKSQLRLRGEQPGRLGSLPSRRGAVLGAGTPVLCPALRGERRPAGSEHWSWEPGLLGSVPGSETSPAWEGQEVPARNQGGRVGGAVGLGHGHGCWGLPLLLLRGPGAGRARGQVSGPALRGWHRFSRPQARVRAAGGGRSRDEAAGGAPGPGGGCCGVAAALPRTRSCPPAGPGRGPLAGAAEGSGPALAAPGSARRRRRRWWERGGE